MPDQSHSFSSLRPNHEARKLQALFHSELCILFWVGSTNTWLYIYILVLYIGGGYIFQGGKSWWNEPRFFSLSSFRLRGSFSYLSAGQCGTTLFQKSSMELSGTKFYYTIFSSLPETLTGIFWKRNNYLERHFSISGTCTFCFSFSTSLYNFRHTAN